MTDDEEIEIDVELHLRWPLARKLSAAAARYMMTPGDLLAMAVDIMIEDDLFDAVVGRPQKPPRPKPTSIDARIARLKAAGRPKIGRPIQKPQAEQIVPPPARPKPITSPQPHKEPLSKPAAATAPAASPANRPVDVGAPGAVFLANEVHIDLRTRRVSHRGGQAVLPDDGVKLLAALARVMPALLGIDQLAQKTFGSTKEAGFKLRSLADRINPGLGRAKLEVRAIPKMGFMLADLGAD